MVDDDLGRETRQVFVMAGLRIHHDQTVEPGDVHFLERSQFDPHQPDHGQVVGTLDRVDIGDGDAGRLAPQQPLDSHGRGNGIGIGVDGDQYMILS